MIENIKINVLGSQHVTNCYIIYDENTKEAALVDPADNEELIIQNLEKLEVNLKYIMLTHAHNDHTIALLPLLEKYKDIKVIASVKEKDMLEGRVSDCSDVFGLKQVIYDLDRFMLLNDNDEFSIGNIKVKIIQTPGHTKGSSCYYIEKENILITGDTLFENCFGRCDLESASIDDMNKSLCRLYKDFKEVNIYPGHGNSNIKIEDTFNEVRRILLNFTGNDLNNMIYGE